MPESFLERIVAATRARLAEREAARDITEVLAAAARQSPPFDFANCLRPLQGEVRVIAEIKRASPSKGVLNSHLKPGAQALEYARNGATAISVLTEEDHFQGSLDDLRAVRRAVPDRAIVRKDFITSSYQVAEARAAGADSYLLLAALLNDQELGTLIQVGREWGMEPLVEVHDAEEVQRAVRVGAQIIGVNARDLRTFEVDTTLLHRLRTLIPDDRVVVAESGLFTQADVARMRGYGADAVLMGEALVRPDQPYVLETVSYLPPIVCDVPRGRYPAIKLCGMRTPEDALAAYDAGADFIGLVLTPSTRQITPEQARTIVYALPPDALTVGVFADEPDAVVNAAAEIAGVYAVQVPRLNDLPHQNRKLNRQAIFARSSADPANEHPPVRASFIRTTMIEAAPPGVWGGTGQTGDWEIAARWAHDLPIILAGGLTPENVAEAVRTVQPWGVDVSSGIEGPDGQKDPARMRAFIQAARGTTKTRGRNTE
jgi:indole-3-glycerol phosphate synthase/phosphoribosylanthranilate isomerase